MITTSLAHGLRSVHAGDRRADAGEGTSALGRMLARGEQRAWPRSAPSTSTPPVHGLDETLDGLVLGTARPRALQGVYREMEDVCSVSESATAALYHRLGRRLKRCMEQMVDTHLGRLPRDDDAACAAWVHAFQLMWTQCQARLHCVTQLMTPLVNTAWYAANATEDIETFCFAHVRKQVVHVLRAESTWVRGVTTLTQRIRAADANPPSGSEPVPPPSEPVPPASDVREALALGARLGVASRLARALVEQTEQHAVHLATSIYAAPGTLPASLTTIAACLAREQEWAAWMYPAAEKERVLATLQSVLLTDHLDALLGLVAPLLAANDQRRLAQLYELLAAADRLKPLAGAVGAYVKSEGMARIQGPDDTLIASLLSFQETMHEVLAESFAHNADVNHAIRDSFEVFVNARRSKPAELLATFADAKLRAGNKIMSDAELESCMTQVLSLFRFMHDKDMFEEFYKRGFAKRLLLSRSASDDAERSMLLKLKTECGPDFTAKLETMLKDMQLSDNLMAAYNERGSDTPFEFEVSVLTQAHWPSFPETDVALPPPMLDALARFTEFYKGVHSGRALHWRHALGFLVVTADLGKAGTKELYISTLQAAVLFVFNHAAPHETIAYERIRAATQLDDAELKRTLQSLASGTIPTRILRKHPQGRDVEETDVFSLNTALKNERRRIRVNHIQHKDTREEQQSTEDRVFIDRELILQAAAMRVLKARKTIRHLDLVTEVVQQIKNRFTVDGNELKKAFELLIEKDGMERVEGERGMYRYIA